jgi:hypothetical protein
LLSSTEPIEIYKDNNGHWHVRDFGRGLRIEHFTLNENKEKSTNTPGIIGKFGVGLKDALATLHRRRVEVYIRSRFGDFFIRQHSKSDFAGIVTLHVAAMPPSQDIEGTDFLFAGLTDDDVQRTKSYFLTFSSEKELDDTAYGSVFAGQMGQSKVYINGVLASIEPGFLFSYNITSLTETMRKQLNRERVNVGRSVYTERVKSILRSSTSQFVLQSLADQLAQRQSGQLCDELQWLDIRQLAINSLQQSNQVTFVTQEEAVARPEVIEKIQSDGYRVVLIDASEKSKVVQQEQQGGPAVRTLENYFVEYNETFQYKFVEKENLLPHELHVFGEAPAIAALVGIFHDLPKILVSETMRLDRVDTLGVWDSELKAIVIQRDQLSGLESFAATLLHELAHATSGHTDSTVAFENVLTAYLGKVAARALQPGK